MAGRRPRTVRQRQQPRTVRQRRQSRAARAWEVGRKSGSHEWVNPKAAYVSQSDDDVLILTDAFAPRPSRRPAAALVRGPHCDMHRFQHAPKFRQQASALPSRALGIERVQRRQRDELHARCGRARLPAAPAARPSSVAASGPANRYAYAGHVCRSARRLRARGSASAPVRRSIRRGTPSSARWRWPRSPRASPTSSTV